VESSGDWSDCEEEFHRTRNVDVSGELQETADRLSYDPAIPDGAGNPVNMPLPFDAGAGEAWPAIRR